MTIEIETIPSKADLAELKARMPERWFPNEVPCAVVIRRFLSPDTCSSIIGRMEQEEPYNHGGCDAAQTREIFPVPFELAAITNAALAINDRYFRFDLDEDNPTAWMQTYGKDNFYETHTDGYPGQSRKLTAVALLSPEDSYVGGNLYLMHVPTEDVVLTHEQGTIVVFPPWILHGVTNVFEGVRHSINMGFWGPAFR